MADDHQIDDDALPDADVPSLEEAPAPAPAPADPAAEAAHAYHQRARLAEDRLAEVLAAYRTIKSENEGFRERISKNLQRRFTQRHETLLLKFIDILDNLDRALEAAQRSYAGEPLLEGMILVRTQLLARLQEEGLERVPVLGLAFDPAVSESVATQPVADPDHHHVVMKELMRGYRVNGRIVRPSQVLIGEYREGAAPAAPEAGEQMIDNEPTVEAPPPEIGELSIEEIVARAEAQAALADALPESEEKEEEEKGEPS